MDHPPELKFLHRFRGPIWNLVASEEVLLIEVRTTSPKEVSFSALNTLTGSFYWKDKVLEENWWVNGAAVIGSRVIFTVYMDTNNPDKKGIVVYSLEQLTMQWWNNDFSLSETGTKYIKGFTSRLGLKQTILNVESGKEAAAELFQPAEPPVFLQKPVQYSDGTDHFETVKKFLADRLNFAAVSALEYMETQHKIIISCYKREDDGLANYLFVLSAEGNVLLKEKLEGRVAGIGFDTFFMLKGCVIFVRNKMELVSFKLI